MSSVPDLLYRERIVHPEQYEAAQDIIGKFADGKRQIMLLAQMQSGKTGIFLYVALSMLRTGIVKNVVILCGSNENELHEQLVAEGGKMVRKFNMASASIKIYKSSDLKNTLTVDSDTLVIWDESHYAQGIQNRPFKFLQRSGLLVGGNADSDVKWAAKNSYFLSVSATPFAEFSDSLHKDFVESTTRAIVRAEPGTDYRGVEYFMAQGAIKSSYSIKENKAAFTALLASFKTQRKYVLIRSRNLSLVRQCATELGIAYKNYTSASKQLHNLDALSEAPPCFTIIGLAGMCRMGKVVPKEHIAFVFEEAKTSKSDTLLQSLLGRLCGYYNTAALKASKPLIFLPAEFSKVDETTNLSEIERYIRNTHGEVIIPAKAAYIAENSSASDKYLLPKPIHVTFSEDDDSEEYGGLSEWREMLSEMDKRVFISEIMREHYAANPISDVTQQREVIEVLQTPRMIALRDMSVEGYANKIALMKDACKNGRRYNENWQDDRQFMVFYNNDGFYFMGYTKEANEDTKAECEGRIVPTTGRECWNPKHTETTDAPFAIINSASDLNALKPGQYTLFVKKSLMSLPLVKSLKRDKLGGGGGKYWPKDAKGNRADYERLVVKITIEITVRITLEIIRV